MKKLQGQSPRWLWLLATVLEVLVGGVVITMLVVSCMPDTAPAAPLHGEAGL